MTQKELLYIEDIYNHENMVITTINDIINKIDEEEMKEILRSQCEKHDKCVKSIEKLLESEANEK